MPRQIFIEALQFPSLAAHVSQVSKLLQPEDFIVHWWQAKERTSSSPSGLHFSHYKSASFSPTLASLHGHFTQLVFMMGLSLQCYQAGLQVILEKKASNKHVDNLCAVLLMEGDFNAAMKIFIGAHMMANSTTWNLLPAECYGSHPGCMAIKSHWTACLLLISQDNLGQPWQWSWSISTPVTTASHILCLPSPANGLGPVAQSLKLFFHDPKHANLPLYSTRQLLHILWWHTHNGATLSRHLSGQWCRSHPMVSHKHSPHWNALPPWPRLYLPVPNQSPICWPHWSHLCWQLWSLCFHPRGQCSLASHLTASGECLHMAGWSTSDPGVLGPAKMLMEPPLLPSTWDMMAPTFSIFHAGRAAGVGQLQESNTH